MNTFLIIAAIVMAPPVPAPSGIPVTSDRIELGRKLFFDPRLSAPVNVGGRLVHTVSCATCHDPDMGWADHNPLAVGVLGRTGTRNSPSIVNAAYHPLVFHDGRTVGTSDQSLQPLANRLEMGDQSESQAINRIRRIPGYVALFQLAYGPGRNGGSPVDRDRFAHAVAAFETTIISFDAPIDRRLAGDVDALTPAAEIGFGIFQAANCASCHKPPLFTDRAFHNNGMEFASRSRANDSGRFGVLPQNQRTNDTVRAFKTGGLREVSRSFPYAHNGAFPDLKSVVRHYNLGGRRFDGFVDRFVDPRIRPLGLTEAQEDYLVIFLTEAMNSPSYPYVTRPALP